jgi:hypothetical protein
VDEGHSRKKNKANRIKIQFTNMLSTSLQRLIYRTGDFAFAKMSRFEEWNVCFASI